MGLMQGFSVIAQTVRRNYVTSKLRGFIMTAFRILLAALFIWIVGYTVITISNHGWNLIPVFFGGILFLSLYLLVVSFKPKAI